MFRPNRRLFQFSLGSLMLLTTAAAVLCAWFGQRIRPYQEQLAIRNTLTERGYRVEVIPAKRDYDLIVGEFITGESFFTVTGLFNCGRSDLDLTDMPPGLELRWLHLSGGHVTDDTIASLPRMPFLNSLALWHCEVTDKTLETLDRFPALEQMRPCDTKMTKRGWDEFQKRSKRIRVVLTEQIGWEGQQLARAEAEKRRRKLQDAMMYSADLDDEFDLNETPSQDRYVMWGQRLEPKMVIDPTEKCPRDRSPAAQERYKSIPAGKLGSTPRR